MRPEVVGPLALVGLGEVEVLELREAEQGRGLDDVDTKDVFEDRVVEVEGVLERELPARVGLLHTCVFDDVDLRGRPAGCEVADDCLLQDGPGAREADEERRRGGEVVLRPEVFGSDVPGGNGRRSGLALHGDEGEVVLDRRRGECRRLLVSRPGSLGLGVRNG